MNLTIEQAFEKAIEAHRAGQIKAADALYTAILKAQPNHPHANHNLGVIALGLGKYREALPFLKKSIDVNPENPQFWQSYINTLFKLERFDDARSTLDKAKSLGFRDDVFDQLEKSLPANSSGSSSDVLVDTDETLNILDTMRLEQALRLARKLSKDGSINKARKIYNDICIKFPKNKEAIQGLKQLTTPHSSNEVLGQDPPLDKIQELENLYVNGDLQQTLKITNSLLNKYPRSAILFNIQGTAYAILKEFEMSFKAYKKSLTLQTNHVGTLNNIGNVLKDQGKLDEAIAYYSKAITIKPDFAEAHNNMGIAQQGQGEFKKASRSFATAVSIRPDYAEAYYNMGNALQDQGVREEAVDPLKKKDLMNKAIAAYKRAIAIKPQYADVYFNMGNALNFKEIYDEALTAYKNAIKFNPNFFSAYNNLGNILKQQGRLEDALIAYEKAISIKNDYHEAYNNLGNVFRELGDSSKEIQAYQMAVSISPDFAEAHNNLGIALQENGKRGDALKAYSRALILKDDYAEAYRNLSSIKKYGLTDPEIDLCKALYRKTGLSDTDKCHLSFALSKMLEDIGEIKQSYEYLVAGNSLRKKLLSYSIEIDRELFKALRLGQSGIDDLDTGQINGLSELVPIFIVGMPRSGTTLIEQIVSAHPKVTGGGELNFIKNLGADLAVGSTNLSNMALLSFRNKYLDELSKKSNGSAYVIDKMPHNFRYLPLICAAFPEAKIIHVKRKPEATCWSNFKHYFVSNSLGYCYDLNDIVEYYNLYTALMQLWIQSYGSRIYNIDYDGLTEHQLLETRSLLDYLELEWNDLCLAPENNMRVVKTASSLQVREKIYKDSSQAWCKYKNFIGPVFDKIHDGSG